MQKLRDKIQTGIRAKTVKSGFVAAALGALLALIPTAGAGGPTGPNGNTLVRKMLAVYKNADSLQADYEAQILRPGGSEYIQSGTIRYRKPDRVALYTTDPLTGTFQAWADGRVISVFSGKDNVYTKRTAPIGGLGPTIEGIEKTSSDVLKVRSTQIFSPLSFIVAKDLPREAQTFTYVKQETILGRKTYCVSAKLNEEFIKELVQNRRAIATQRDVKLWIDANNSQLVRSFTVLVWKFPVQGGTAAKPAYNQAGIAFTETYNSTVINGAIRDDVFHFTPPAGAKQLFQESR